MEIVNHVKWRLYDELLMKMKFSMDATDYMYFTNNGMSMLKLYLKMMNVVEETTDDENNHMLVVEYDDKIVNQDNFKLFIESLKKKYPKSSYLEYNSVSNDIVVIYTTKQLPPLDKFNFGDLIMLDNLKLAIKIPTKNKWIILGNVILYEICQMFSYTHFIEWNKKVIRCGYDKKYLIEGLMIDKTNSWCLKIMNINMNDIKKAKEEETDKKVGLSFPIIYLRDYNPVDFSSLLMKEDRCQLILDHTALNKYGFNLGSSIKKKFVISVAELFNPMSNTVEKLPIARI